MADQLEIPTGNGGLAAEAPQPGDSVPANQPQSGDVKLTAILQKKASGETLSAAERGYLGSVKRRGKKLAPAPKPNENILLATASPATAPADNPLFIAQPPSEAPADSMAGPAVDSGLIQKTAGAILDSLDAATKIFVGHEAKKAGADEHTISAYKSAVALQPENRELMVANSEPVVLGLCKIFKTTPDRLSDVLKNCGFLGGLAAHSLAVFTAVKSIRESAKEKQQPKA